MGMFDADKGRLSWMKVGHHPGGHVKARSAAADRAHRRWKPDHDVAFAADAKMHIGFEAHLMAGKRPPLHEDHIPLPLALGKDPCKAWASPCGTTLFLASFYLNRFLGNAQLQIGAVYSPAMPEVPMVSTICDWLITKTVIGTAIKITVTAAATPARPTPPPMIWLRA